MSRRPVMTFPARVTARIERLIGSMVLVESVSARSIASGERTAPITARTEALDDATHAWASVWTPQNQWLGLDPTNDQMVDERYIIVGWGRDYADVPPLRGIIYTDSESSVIDVSVDVAPFEGDVLHA